MKLELKVVVEKSKSTHEDYNYIAYVNRENGLAVYAKTKEMAFNKFLIALLENIAFNLGVDKKKILNRRIIVETVVEGENIVNLNINL